MNSGKFRMQWMQKESEHEALAKQTAELWGGLDSNNEQIRAKQTQIENHVKRIAYLRSEYTKEKAALRLCTGRIKNLTVRKERFQANLAEIEKSSPSWSKFKRTRKPSLKTLKHTIERKKTQKETVEKEIAEAEKIASSAKEAVIEFATQRDLAATIAAEEKACEALRKWAMSAQSTGSMAGCAT